MEWLVRDWDQHHVIAFVVGLAAGLTLVIMGKSGIAEIGAMGAAVVLRWAIWQIPPPGRSTAQHMPDDGAARLMQLAVAVLLVTLAADLITAPFH